MGALQTPIWRPISRESAALADQLRQRTDVAAEAVGAMPETSATRRRYEASRVIDTTGIEETDSNPGRPTHSVRGLSERTL